MDEHNKQNLQTVDDSDEAAAKLISDLWRSLSKPLHVAEKPLENFSEQELAKMSKTAASIIAHNNDFQYAPKRDQIRYIFEAAVSKGPDAVKQLTDAINNELLEKKSTVRCTGTYSKESETVDESVQPKDPTLLIYVSPQYYKHTYACGNFYLSDSQTGSVEDSTSVRGTELQKEYLGDSRESLLPRIELH